jgi:hypothetical protein
VIRVRRRCWPDPSDAATRRDTRTSQTAAESADEDRAEDEAHQDVGGARIRTRRVEDASTTTQRAQIGWQVRPNERYFVCAGNVCVS